MDNENESSNVKQERFIELRANGDSYDSIAKQIKVSKPTLISWSKKFSIDLHNMREIQRECVREQYAISRHHRVAMLSEQLKKAHTELSKRDYSDVPTQQLLSLIMKVEARIARENSDAVTFLEDISGWQFETNETSTWEG